MKKIFIIHSLKLLPEAIKLETDLGTPCYIPGRDTQQTKTTAFDILRANYIAMKHSALRVYVIWDGQSQGTIFDMGMAYALGKEIMPFTFANSRSWVSFFEDNIKKIIQFK